MNKKAKSGLGWVLLRFFVIFTAHTLGTILLQASFLLSVAGTVFSLLLPVLGVALALGIVVGVLYLYLTYVEHRKFSDIGLANYFSSFQKICLGIGVGILAILLSALPLYLLNVYKIEFSGVGFYSILMSLLFYIFVGFSEEVLMRGVLLHGLLKLGTIPALLISSSVFSLLHLLNPGVTMLSLLNIFLAGLVFGLLTYATRNIWASVGMHIIWNWMLGNFLGIPVSGTQIGNSIFKTTIISGSDWLTGGSFGLEGTLSCSVVLLVIALVLHSISKKNGGYAYYAALGKGEDAAAGAKWFREPE